MTVGENLAASPVLVAAARVDSAFARAAATAALVCAAATALVGVGVGVADGDFEQASSRIAVTATAARVMAGAEIERPLAGLLLSMNTS
jgi:uncharacterized membrane protein